MGTVVLCCSTGPVALLAGIAFAAVLGNPFPDLTKKWTPLLLQLSIVGMGAGVDLWVIGTVGMQGIVYSAVGIGLTLLICLGLGKILRTEAESSLLLGVGTAICGGSAIAALAPVIKAKNQTISVALGTIFLLNASALFFFPWLGHRVGLDEHQFGLFCGFAIHDTSSVVGTAMQYGYQALEVATTVKLARALWIAPVTLIIGWGWARLGKNRGEQKAKFPLFILGFLLAAFLVTTFPNLRESGQILASGARRSFILTLFLIGSGLSPGAIRAVGPRPFVQGFLTWVIAASGTLLTIYWGWVH